MIREEFLHFIWKYRLVDTEYLNYRGKKIEVIDPGLHNHSSGPDFFNARIKIGSTLWAGNIEIHKKASDWYLHRHENDPAYDNIILHLVYDPDISVYRKNGEEIPFARMAFHPQLIKKYNKLISGKDDRECYHFFAGSDSLFYQDWIGKLGAGRLERKVDEVNRHLEETHHDWEEVLYRMLAGAFGARQNKEPFLLLARSVPLRFFYRNRDNPLSINAAYFGQAGFLDETISDDHYYCRLQKEYAGLKAYLPEALPGRYIWKMMRSRPPAFPSVRIPQFIALVKNAFPLWNDLKEVQSVKQMRKIFTSSIKNYWVEHYLYGKPGRRPEFMPSTESMNIWILNAVVPFVFCYGKLRKKEEYLERVLQIMEQLPAENNEILKKWNKFGIEAKHAFDSQALIELRTKYCEPSRCTECMIGHKILLNEEKR